MIVPICLTAIVSPGSPLRNGPNTGKSRELGRSYFRFFDYLAPLDEVEWSRQRSDEIGERQMGKFARCLVLVAVVTVASLAVQGDAHAQYPVSVTTVQPVVPTAVVGYTAERRGLFGWRVVYRPIVAPVAAPVPVTTTVSVARPVISAPLSAPVTVGYAPVEAPVTSYYAPPVPIAAPPVPVAVPMVPPVTTLRVPVPVVTPYIGY